MRRFRIPVAICLCLLTVVSQYTTVASKDIWVAVRTKNFLLVGNASEKDIKLVGVKLEQFREVFTRFFPNTKFKTPVPTTVMVFKNASSYAPFKIREQSSGHFQSGQDVNYIALTADIKGDGFSVIFHEFTHLLVNNNFKNVPVWFNEGLAEYYSKFHMSEDQRVVLGYPIVSHVLHLRKNKMLPLRTLFEVDHKSAHYNESDKTSIFYAQSWALVHYLMIGKTGRDEQLNKFTELLGSRVPQEKAFKEAFGTTLEAMETELSAYVGQDRYKVRLGNFAGELKVDTTTEATRLTEAEAQAYQGDLLLHSNRKEAYTYLEQAVKLDPSLAMAHASLGMSYFRDGKTTEAHASLERAVTANSQNYLAHYQYAFVLSRANDTASIAMFTPEQAAKIRGHLQKAIALRPDFLEPYNLLAYVSLVTAKDIDETIVTLKRVLSESPDQYNLAYMLGQLYFHKDDFKNARIVLEQVVNSNAEEEVRRHAGALLKTAKTSEEQIARNEAAKQKAATIVVDAKNHSDVKEVVIDPSAQLREALRAPAAGEVRLQATLVKIDCDPKTGGIAFVVKTASGLMRFTTTSFNNVEMKTWDAAVSGEITCGERKPETSVVVCYIPQTVTNTDKRVKTQTHGILKSIEFVPSDFKLKPPA